MDAPAHVVEPFQRQLLGLVWQRPENLVDPVCRLERERGEASLDPGSRSNKSGDDGQKACAPTLQPLPRIVEFVECIVKDDV